MSAVQVDEAPAYCILLKTDLFSYRVLVMHPESWASTERREGLQG